MGLTDFRPAARVIVDGVPLSGLMFSQGNSVRINDVAGFVSDTAELVFANSSFLSRFVMPEPGAEVQIEMGYWGRMRSMGLYIVDDVEEASPPRVISIDCLAKAQGETSGGQGPIHQQKTRTWAAGMTLRAIVQTVAADNGLTPKVTDSVAGIVPGHIDQVDESDIAMLTRISFDHDLLVKPAGGVLFVGLRAEAVNASGSPMPTIPLLERDVSRWSMRRSFGEVVGSVIAIYRDLEAGQDVEVRVGEGEPERRLRQRFRNEEEARVAANAEARRAGRRVEKLQIEMPGNPLVSAEAIVQPLDFSSAAFGDWVVESATHTMSDGGYITTLKAQRPD